MEGCSAWCQFQPIFLQLDTKRMLLLWSNWNGQFPSYKCPESESTSIELSDYRQQKTLVVWVKLITVWIYLAFNSPCKQFMSSSIHSCLWRSCRNCLRAFLLQFDTLLISGLASAGIRKNTIYWKIGDFSLSYFNPEVADFLTYHVTIRIFSQLRGISAANFLITILLSTVTARMDHKVTEFKAQWTKFLANLP